MQRFPNPGSDIPTFIRIFQILHSYLKNNGSFSLDDMSSTLTYTNLASSSGYMGEQALRLSTRNDRSRDPLYNQSKMYAELYRILGWIQSTEEKTLEFSFTYLGEHMASAKSNPLPLFQESLLGINYPNEVISVKSDNKIRPFATILRCMLDLDEILCRDEMIIGPLSLNDVDNNYRVMIDMIRKIRREKNNNKELADALNKLSESTKIKVNTLHNYTRFPLAALKYSGWVSSDKIKIYKGRGTMLKLTDEGRKRAEWIKSSIDIGAEISEHESKEDLDKIIRISFFKMLERSYFDISSIREELASEFADIEEIYRNKDILLSPYQTFRREKLESALGKYYKSEKNMIDEQAKKLPSDHLPSYEVEKQKVLKSTIVLKEIVSDKPKFSNGIALQIHEKKAVYGEDIDNIVEQLIKEYETADKTVFYPLVANLFQLLGFPCENPRHGINYQRWDAIIVDDQYCIPIEIKSPSEEEFISVKAIRQALENKIVLLSRKVHPTNFESPSFVVGFNSPNERADVGRLISDIYDTFGIKIAVFDLRTLLILVVQKVLRGKTITMEQLRMLGGIIDVQDI
ncbi:hypothetical protein [Brevibacillus brevis]|uniref:Restriction endonuclease n=1 Tax=Brevibacillus brevis TaxID=1393 RepID=A0ABY9T2L7_BREBE|nr:hypothetical protein [Brevibacillus brevis]WNC14355.1 hypothetical protein RGB73_27395 [Brevibacillus brevis]